MEIISLSGEVSRQTQASLWRKITPVLARQPRSILLDFSGVDYMAISSIAVLVELLKQARLQSITVAVCGLREPFNEMLELSRLSSCMEIFPHQADAVLNFS